MYNEYFEECLKNGKGNTYLLRGYLCSKKEDLQMLTINDMGFIYSHKDKLLDFKSELIKSGLKRFLLTESSSALMSIIHGLDSINIKLTGVIKIKTKNEIVKGLEFTIS